MPVRQAVVGDEEAEEVKQEPDEMLSSHCFSSMKINPEICIVVRFDLVLSCMLKSHKRGMRV